MKKDKIELLLEKYWAGETNIEEERFIKQYLADNTTDELSEERSYFKSIQDFQQVRLFGNKFGNENQRRPLKYLSVGYFLRIAAVLIIGTSMVIFGVNYNRQYQEQKQQEMQKKVEDDLIAISKTLNKGYNNLNASSISIINLNKTKN